MKPSNRKVLILALSLALSMLIAAQAVGQSTSATPVTQCGTAVVQGVGNYFSQGLLIIRTTSGSYRSTTQGWQHIPSPNNQPIQVGAGGSLYIYDKNSSEIHQSLDGGQTWVLTGVFTYTDPTAIEFFFASPITATIFIGVHYPFPTTGVYRGTYKSSDGGLSWHMVITDSAASEMAFSPNIAQDGIAFATNDYGGFWKTEDKGETWIPLTSSFRLGNIAGTTLTPASPTFIIPATLLFVSPGFLQDHTVFIISGGSVSKSIDGGETWTLVSTLPDIYQTNAALSPNYLDDQTLLVANWYGNGLFISHDGAQTWQQLNFPYTLGFPEYSDIVGLRLSGPFGMWPVSPPFSVGPYQVYLPLINVSNTSRALELWAIGYDDTLYQNHLMRSRDQGVTWEEVCVFEAAHWQYLPLIKRDSLIR